MKAKNNKEWMVWAIISLAILNISTIITVVYQSNKTKQIQALPPTDQIQTESTSLQYSGRYFGDQLNLDEKQMNIYNEFNPDFRRQALDINVELNRKRNQMLTEMATKNYDTNYLNMLSDSIGFLHARLKKVTYRYYLDIKDICDQQQQEKLKILFNDMFTTDIPQGRNGNGRQLRLRYRGGRFNN